MTDNVYLNTAFAFMVCDGVIVNDELEALKDMAGRWVYRSGNLDSQIQQLVEQFNAEGRQFMRSYLDSLDRREFSADQAIAILQIAHRIIVADGNYAYSEVKFFKAVRSHFKFIDDEHILSKIPHLEDYWLDADINAPYPDLDYLSSVNFSQITLPNK